MADRKRRRSIFQVDHDGWIQRPDRARLHIPDPQPRETDMDPADKTPPPAHLQSFLKAFLQVRAEPGLIKTGRVQCRNGIADENWSTLHGKSALGQLLTGEKSFNQLAREYPPFAETLCELNITPLSTTSSRKSD